VIKFNPYNEKVLSTANITVENFRLRINAVTLSCTVAGEKTKAWLTTAASNLKKLLRLGNEKHVTKLNMPQFGGLQYLLAVALE
jgi:hypothetical protein